MPHRLILALYERKHLRVMNTGDTENTSSDDLIEEFTTADTEQYIYVDFSPFRNFGNVKIVSALTGQHETPVVFTDEVATSSPPCDSHPTIVKKTLETDHPLIQFGTSLFRGTWSTEHVCSSSVVKRTNLVVAELMSQSSSDNVANQSQSQKGKRARSEPQVPSLLQHLPHGTDSDTAAKLLRIARAENEARWNISSVVAPSAVLTLERVA
jgi:hypothetical protein